MEPSVKLSLGTNKSRLIRNPDTRQRKNRGVRRRSYTSVMNGQDSKACWSIHSISDAADSISLRRSDRCRNQRDQPSATGWVVSRSDARLKRSTKMVGREIRESTHSSLFAEGAAQDKASVSSKEVSTVGINQTPNGEDTSGAIAPPTSCSLPRDNARRINVFRSMPITSEPSHTETMCTDDTEGRHDVSERRKRTQQETNCYDRIWREIQKGKKKAHRKTEEMFIGNLKRLSNGLPNTGAEWRRLDSERQRLLSRDLLQVRQRREVQLYLKYKVRREGIRSRCIKMMNAVRKAREEALGFDATLLSLKQLNM